MTLAVTATPVEGVQEDDGEAPGQPRPLLEGETTQLRSSCPSYSIRAGLFISSLINYGWYSLDRLWQQRLRLSNYLLRPSLTQEI